MEELIDVIDENDHVVGTLPRDVIRRKHLLHRGIAVILRDSKGRIFVHRRTADRMIYPSCYDCFIGGAVKAGETFEEAAERELFEEVGIRAKLRFLFRNRYKSDILNVLSCVFGCIHDGELILDKQEIDSGRFMREKELEELMKKEKFCGDSISLYRRCEDG